MRQFIQRVTMPCTFIQFLDDLRDPLTDLGYDTSKMLLKTMKSIQANCWDGMISASNLQEWSSTGFYHTNFYNPELFLAIAAMSAGDEFYPGEWVVCEKAGSTLVDKGGLVKVKYVFKNNDPFNAKIYSDMFKSLSSWMYMYSGVNDESPNFRKATLGEILSHFNHQKQAKDQREAAKDLIDGLSEAAKEREKSVEDIIYEQKKKGLEMFETRLPKFGEDILVWDDNDEARIKMQFVCEAEGKVWAYDKDDDEIGISPESKYIYSYDHWSLPNAEIFISRKDIINKLADDYNVDPSLIRITE